MYSKQKKTKQNPIKCFSSILNFLKIYYLKFKFVIKVPKFLIYSTFRVLICIFLLTCVCVCMYKRERYVRVRACMYEYINVYLWAYASGYIPLTDTVTCIYALVRVIMYLWI